MTIPVWAPFGLLALLCAVYPPPRRPAWTYTVDWLAVLALVGGVVFCVAFWINIAFLVSRYA